ncbi:MAG: dienelactone hydrolase family protein [Woeseia sp.]
MNRQYKGNSKYIPGLLFVLFSLAACEPQQTEEDADKAAAIENVDAMSREHANDTAIPSEGAKIPAQRPVVAERLAYAEVGDNLSYGHFVIPADMVKPLPAIIVIHEWWGLNDGVRAMADRLAGLGYIVLAVDLFGGKSATEPGDARALMMEVVENPDSANENIRQAYEFVKNTAGAPRIASLGWCFGGGWSLNTALLFPEELDAAVIFYGRVTASESRLKPLNVPILGIFGAEDSGIPVDSVRDFEKALDNLGKEYEIEIYPDVGHAFANPSGNNYDAAAADRAWEQTVAFLNRHLRGTD